MVYFSRRATEIEEPDMQSIHDAARRLMIADVVDDMPSGAQLVASYVQAHGIEVDAEGFVSDNDYDDIVAELKG